MSWHYFHQFSDDIYNAFDFAAERKEKAKSRMRKALETVNVTSEDTVVVGIHNRRGDFVKSNKIEFGHMAGETDYFEAAMMYFRRQYYFDVKQPLFLMIGDAYNWNLQHFGDESDVLVIKPGDAVDDMCFLTIWDQLILSSGSYSWWSGYLHGGPVVITALYARRNSSLAAQISRDYYLPYWITL